MKFLLSLALFILAPPVMACSIVIPKSKLHLHTTEAYFRQARDVAVVEVERVDEIVVDGSRRRLMQFSTVQRFKGSLPESFSRDMGQDLSCGPEYLPGRRYVWFIAAPEKNQIDGYFIKANGPLEDGVAWTNRYLEELSSLSKSTAKNP